MCLVWRVWLEAGPAVSLLGNKRSTTSLSLLCSAARWSCSLRVEHESSAKFFLSPSCPVLSTLCRVALHFALAMRKDRRVSLPHNKSGVFATHMRCCCGIWSYLQGKSLWFQRKDTLPKKNAEYDFFGSWFKTNPFLHFLFFPPCMELGDVM